MHFTTFFTMALIAFTSMTSAGTLHDRRRDNRLQVMRRNRGQFLHAGHNGKRHDGVKVPDSSISSTPGERSSTTTVGAGPNSTIGLNATTTTGILQFTTSELILTSEIGAVDTNACPPAVTVTVTETSISISSVVGGGETQTSDESASIVTTLTESTDPAITIDASASIVTTLSESRALSTADPALSTVVEETLKLTAPADGSPPFTFVPYTSSSTPVATNIAEIEQPALEQPIPLEDGDVTTQIFTQTISSPAATLVFESTIRRGRNRGKVITITEKSPESAGVETVTVVVTQSERIELVTSESGVAAKPTAIVVDGIASEVQSATTESSVATEIASVGETSVALTDGNAAIVTSTSCTDGGVTLISPITVDAPASTASAVPEIPDANENVISMISVITLTKSADPFVTTTNIDGVPALITATREPELILSTITLGPGGATGTGTAAPVETGEGSGGGNGRGKGKGKGRKNKGEGKGNGRCNGNDSTGEEDGNEAGVGVGRNQNNAGGRGQCIGRGSAGGDYD